MMKGCLERDEFLSVFYFKSNIFLWSSPKKNGMVVAVHLSRSYSYVMFIYLSIQSEMSLIAEQNLLIKLQIFMELY